MLQASKIRFAFHIRLFYAEIPVLRANWSAFYIFMDQLQDGLAFHFSAFGVSQVLVKKTAPMLSKKETIYFFTGSHH